MLHSPPLRLSLPHTNCSALLSLCCYYADLQRTEKNKKSVLTVLTAIHEFTLGRINDPEIICQLSYLEKKLSSKWELLPFTSDKICTRQK